jgi:hydrogenase maturation protein HypF
MMEDKRCQRLRVIIRGAVQGVGFRPFVYRLAAELKLSGWVNNSPQGVHIEVEGEQSRLQEFLLRIPSEKPPRSSIQSLESSFLDPVGFDHFDIRRSDTAGEKNTLVLPDIATCPDCIRDIFDPADRRYLYPFTNCTNCGPRYSIVEALPYDRPNTSMKQFRMCKNCQEEYKDPRDRRFHAQPNACPECGPHLEFWVPGGKCIASHNEALLAAADAIRQGMIIAVKGLGGFHLICDARKDSAVINLRKRKHREEKPLALMYSSLEMVQDQCEVSPIEERILLSPESPIVLLRRHNVDDDRISPSVAPGNPYLGIMLPYTPLHHILMRELQFPVVATSGNLKEEPICIDEYVALVRLKNIADFFLVHDRPIVRHVDDSIVRVIAGRELVMRRARGYAPLPVPFHGMNHSVLAVGGHLKNSVALGIGTNVFISQHIGDLETTQSYQAFEQTIQSLNRLYEAAPGIIVCDKHPDYFSTKYAKQSDIPVIDVQHHYAHILSCMAENEVQGTALGVSWDGTGYGLDGTIWGGEFLKITDHSFERIAHFRYFPLPGGEQAIKEPRRAALGLLYEMYAKKLVGMIGKASSPRKRESSLESPTLKFLEAFSDSELKNLLTMLEKGINSPKTSSAGRLFDAVSSLVGIRHTNAFEGQAAMELEFLADGVEIDDNYCYTIDSSAKPHVVDWQPMISQIISDLRDDIPAKVVAAKFHSTLSEIVVATAKIASEERVVLSGGCFQNRLLTERTISRLSEQGLRPYWHQRVPPNDGGIALGQVAAASRSAK